MNLKKHFLFLKIILILLSVLEFAFFIYIFTSRDLEFFNEEISSALKAIHFLVVFIFLYYIWFFIPYTRKHRIDKSLLIIILGIIGMWLWLPNDKEISKLTDEQKK